MDEIQAHIGDLVRYYPKGHSALRQVLAYLNINKVLFHPT